MHAKSLTYRSNARKKKIVIAAPKRRSISKNSKIQTCFLDQNPGENHIGFSEKDLVLSENRKGKSQADASFARRKAIMLKIAQQSTTDYSPHKDEIEFYFSEQEGPTDETVFTLQNSSDDSENDEF